MKRVVLIILAVSIAVSCLCLLTSCNQTPLEKAVKKVDKEIKEMDEGEGRVGEASYETKFEYDEAKDEYNYTVKVDIPEGSELRPAGIAKDIYLTQWGYLDEFGNVNLIVEVYRNGVFYDRYVNDQTLQN